MVTMVPSSSVIFHAPWSWVLYLGDFPFGSHSFLQEWLLIFLQGLASVEQVNFTPSSGSTSAMVREVLKSCVLIKLIITWNFLATLLRCLMSYLTKGSEKYPLSSQITLRLGLSSWNMMLGGVLCSDPSASRPRDAFLQLGCWMLTAVKWVHLQEFPSGQESCLTQSHTLFPGDRLYTMTGQ